MITEEYLKRSRLFPAFESFTPRGSSRSRVVGTALGRFLSVLREAGAIAPAALPPREDRALARRSIVHHFAAHPPLPA
jgi:hypothetical protein